MCRTPPGFEASLKLRKQPNGIGAFQHVEGRLQFAKSQLLWQENSPGRSFVKNGLKRKLDDRMLSLDSFDSSATLKFGLHS